MARTLCRVAGAALLVVGFVGFASPGLLGMHLTPIHNVIHLLSGGIALYLGLQGSWGAVRTFCLVFGATYLSLAVLGFVAPDVVARLIGHAAYANARALLPDNLVHVVLGGAFLAAGLTMPAARAARV